MEKVLGYMYNKDTKVYTDTVDVVKDPLESIKQGRFVPLIPANCTLVAVPDEKDGFDRVWNAEGKRWDYIEKVEPVEPTPEPPSELELAYQDLYTAQSKLSNTDYRVLKCFEAYMLKKEMPYDLESLVADRDSWREEVNTAQNKVNALQGTEQVQDESATAEQPEQVAETTAENDEMMSAIAFNSMAFENTESAEITAENAE